MTTTSPSSPPVSVPLWRNRDYLLRWAGQAVSIFGSQVSLIAFPLLMYALTGSAAQAGFLSALRIVPYLALSLPAGALVDRWDRKRTMILCDSARAVAMGSIPAALWTDRLSLVQLYAVSLIEGSLMVFFSLSATASIPQIVEREQIATAMGQSEATFRLGAIAGPPLGGLLYGLGRALPFLVDAVSYAGSVISLLFIRREFQEDRQAAERNLRAEIAEGLTWLWKQPVVRTIGFLSVGVWIMLSALDLLVIVFGRQHHAPPWFIGAVLAFGGIGGILGSLVASRVQRRFGFGQVIIACAWMWACVWPLYAIAPNLAVVGAITAVLFLVWPVYNVVQMSYRIALVPDHLQGRVNSVFRLIAFSGQPIGFALSGALLQTVGTRGAVLVLAVAPLAMAVAATASPHIRGARPIGEVRAA